MKKALLISSIAVAITAAAGLTAPVAHANGNEVPLPRAAAVDGEPVIELAICLDTSGSMDGLLNSARQKLWTIVNDLAQAEPTPRLRVALLSYGNDGHAEENGWVKVETPFTEDLDVVSQMLFGLTTNGGTELVARVVQTSIEELDWYPSAGALRMIFVAGNESAEQDEKVAARVICNEAKANGIDVNAIYCAYGDDGSEVRSGWRTLASAGNGEFATIDQDNGTVVIATPYDAELIELSAALNKTYIPFGDAGSAGCSNQAAQDKNALGMNTANAASRAATKAGKLYSCSWDLVDATRKGEVDLAEVPAKDLPEDMREMTLAQRKARIESMQEERTKIQGQVKALDTLRQALLRKELARQAKTPNAGSFDLAIRNAMRTRAEARGFSFTAVEAPAQTKSPTVILAAATESTKTAHYFVKFPGSPNTDVWVSNDLAAKFDDTLRAGKDYQHDAHIIPGSPEAEVFIKKLPTEVQDLVRSLEGAIYFGWGGKTYLLTGGC